jgi:hypothetical protein
MLKQFGSVTVAALLLLSGCQKQPKPESEKQLVEKERPVKEDRLAKAIENADALKAMHSSWETLTQPVPLTIVATAYIDNAAKTAPEFDAYKKLLQKISEDPSLLDSFSERSISARYSGISVIDYDRSALHRARFNAAYTHRLDAKEKLTDVLRPDIETSSAELLIRLNYEELRKGNLTIEGYKTIKEAGKERNSHYFTLRKTGYDRLNKEAKNQAIINSLLAALELSIPEYMAIDRKNLIKQGETFRMITDNPDGTATGRVYKFDIETEVDKLEKEKKGIDDPIRLEAIDKRIETIKASRSYREYQTRQLLYMTPVSQTDIDTLNHYGYGHIVNRYDQLSSDDAELIGHTLGYSLPDPFLIHNYALYRTRLNGMKMNIGDIRRVGKALHFMGAKASSLESKENVADAVETVVGGALSILSFAALGQGIDTAGMMDAARGDLKGLKEEPQESLFYAVSHHTFGSEGLQQVSTAKIGNTVYGQVLFNENEDDNRIYSAMSQDESRIFQWTYDGEGKDDGKGVLFDTVTMKVIKIIKNMPSPKKLDFFDNAYPYKRVLFDVNPNRVFLYTVKHELFLYDLMEEKIVREYTGFKEPDGINLTMRISPNGKYLYVAHNDEAVLFDVSSAKRLKEYQRQSSNVFNRQWYYNAQFLSDQYLLVAQRKKTTLDLINLSTFEVKQIPMKHEGTLVGAKMEDGILTFVTSDYKPLLKGDHYFMRWDVAKQEELLAEEIGEIGGMLLLANLDKGYYIVADDEELSIVDIQSLKPVHTYLTQGLFLKAMASETGRYVIAEAWRPDIHHLFDLSLMDIIAKEY